MALPAEKVESLEASAAEHARCIASLVEMMWTESIVKRDVRRADLLAGLLGDTRQLQQGLELLAGEEPRT